MPRIYQRLVVCFIFLISLFFLLSSRTLAHEIGYGAITTNLVVEDNEINFSTDTPIALTFETEIEEEMNAIIADYYNHAFFIEQEGTVCEVVVNEIAVFGEERTVVEGMYTCPVEVTNIDSLRITNYVFSEFFNPYDHFVNFEINGEVLEIIFTPEKRTYPFENASSSGEEAMPDNLFGIIERFIYIGIEHIIFGFDHLLFLLATVIVLFSFRRVFILVTSFTIAHSVTLIAASMGWILISSQFVEPIIALSIGVLAVRNLWILHFGKDTLLKERWLVVFGFGLIHGLGFAGALSEISIPGQYFLPALISFNIGVEVGQLMVLAVVIPYLLLLRGHKLRQKILFSVSLAIALISFYWFFERVFF